MLENDNGLHQKTPAAMVLNNTVLISLGMSAASERSIKDILQYFHKLGKTTKNTDFIHTSSLKLKALSHSLNAALVLHTGLCQPRLTKKLKQIEYQLQNIDLSIITFNKVIIEESRVIEGPFLLDFIKQLQPELFAWRMP